MPRGIRKENLPEKTCAHCRRPFIWRKKWARDWDNVRFCSERCRQGKPARAADPGPGDTATLSARQKKLQAGR